MINKLNEKKNYQIIPKWFLRQAGDIYQNILIYGINIKFY